MKEIFPILLSVVGLACCWAQNPAMPIDSSSGSASAATAVQQGQAAGLDEGNAAMSQIDSAQQAQPQALPATGERVPPADSGRAVQLLVSALLLIIAVAGLVVALMAKKSAAAARQSGREEMNALKTAMKKRASDLENALQLMEQRLSCMERAAWQDHAPAAPVPSSRPQDSHHKKQPQKLYLTRPDRRGYFMAASAQFERGNSIYELITADGVNGTFQVIDNDEVHQLALMMPTENITGACTGSNIQMSGGARRIVTEAPGTARKENGQWRIVTMATIHYEA